MWWEQEFLKEPVWVWIAMSPVIAFTLYLASFWPLIAIMMLREAVDQWREWAAAARRRRSDRRRP